MDVAAPTLYMDWGALPLDQPQARWLEKQVYTRRKVVYFSAINIKTLVFSKYGNIVSDVVSPAYTKADISASVRENIAITVFTNVNTPKEAAHFSEHINPLI